MRELELIAEIRREFRGRRGGQVALGIGDDCAILRPKRGHEVLITTDFSLEGKHFRLDTHPPEAVGHRCLARGLSDLAAMGVSPVMSFLSLALPGEMLETAKGRAWVRRFLAGMRELGERYGVTLAGGDTAESGSGTTGGGVLADIVLVGSAPVGTSLRRSGGRAGDLLYVTGALGGAAAELREMLARPSGGRKVARTEGHPQLFPEPRVAVGMTLRRRGLAAACMDLSDGLSTDLVHLCAESRVGAEVEADLVPVHALAGLEDALHGGEDYELLFSARAGVKVPRQIAGVAVTRIGRLVRGNGVVLVEGGKKRALKAGGWEHFRTVGSC